jgi:hypothetical protein
VGLGQGAAGGEGETNRISVTLGSVSRRELKILVVQQWSQVL